MRRPPGQPRTRRPPSNDDEAPRPHSIPQPLQSSREALRVSESHQLLPGRPTHHQVAPGLFEQLRQATFIPRASRAPPTVTLGAGSPNKARSVKPRRGVPAPSAEAARCPSPQPAGSPRDPGQDIAARNVAAATSAAVRNASSRSSRDICRLSSSTQMRAALTASPSRRASLTSPPATMSAPLRLSSPVSSSCMVW